MQGDFPKKGGMVNASISTDGSAINGGKKNEF